MSAKCIFCENALDADTKPEHVLLDALGGRKTSRRIICSTCNNIFGSTIDKELSNQVATLRTTLQFKSGSGADAPGAYRIDSSLGRINILGDGSTEIAEKRYTLVEKEDKTVEVFIKARSVKELDASYHKLPHN